MGDSDTRGAVMIKGFVMIALYNVQWCCSSYSSSRFVAGRGGMPFGIVSGLEGL